MAPEPPLLTMSGITKSFPGVRALDGVDLEVQAGEVHCLLGQNGAGKSTLIKVLAGARQPDDGEITWRGEPVRLKSPIAAMRLGIATIYQELDLVEGLSVAENVFLGHEPTSALHRPYGGGACGGEGAAGPPRASGDRPRPARRRPLRRPAADRLHGAGALHEVRLIVMDEPSAALDPDEVDNLFRIVESLTADGVAVVYISHRLEEIRRIGDRVTVIKDGRTVAVGLPAADTPTRDIVAMMTGRDVAYVFPPRPEEPAAFTAEPVLRVQGLSRKGEFAPVDLELRPGEIVGLAGLVGSGRSEILETIYGARKATTGTVTVDGKQLRPGSVRAAVAAGIGLAPEERKAQALLMTESVTRNVSVSSLSRFARFGWIDRGGERKAARSARANCRCGPTTRDAAVRTLSGGNQQKAVLARWLLRGCRVVLLDEPTRGVDVGARAELYAVIRRLADEGSPSCSSPAKCPKSWASPTGCWSSARAKWSTRPPPRSSTSTAYSTS
ncbi:sugar ABC transporter ATP-binding protein [Streptomyces badius]